MNLCQCLLSFDNGIFAGRNNFFGGKQHNLYDDTKYMHNADVHKQFQLCYN